MDEGDPRIEVGPEAVDERQRERDLGDEHEARPATGERPGQELRVDRGLAAAGDAVEQDDPRAPAGHCPFYGLNGRRLLRAELAAFGPAPAPPGRPRLQRAPGRLASVDLHEAPASERCHRRRPVAGRELGRRQPARRGRGEILEQGTLARAETSRPRGVRRRGGRSAPSAARRRRQAASSRGRSGRASRAPGAGGGARAGPPRPRCSARPWAPRRGPRGSPRPRARGRRSRPGRDRSGRSGRSRISRGIRGPALGDELQPLEHARREHGPERQRGWRQVPIGDPFGQAHPKGREERAVRAHAPDDRLRLDARHLGAGPQHDPERLPPAELDQHRLPHREISERVRHPVRVRAVPRRACRVDRDRDDSVVRHDLRPACGGPGGQPSRRG